jgi:hypothetical protein
MINDRKYHWCLMAGLVPLIELMLTYGSLALDLGRMW